MKKSLLGSQNQMVKQSLASRLSRLFITSVIIQATFSAVLSTEAYAQMRREGRDHKRDRGSMGSIHINSGTNLPSNRYEDYDLEEAIDKSNREDRNFDRVKKMAESANQQAQQANRREDEINKKVQETLKRIESNQQKERTLQTEVQNLQNSVKKSEERIQTLQKEVQSLNTQIASVTSVIADLKAKMDATTDEAEKAKLAGQIDGQAKVLDGLSSQLNAKNAEIGTVSGQLQNQKQSMTQKARELEQAKQELSKAQGELPGLVSDQQRLRDDAQRLGRELEKVNREVELARRELTLAHDRVERVRKNIDLAKMILEGEAQRDGTEDGQREGLELGELRGGAEGRRLGENEGRSYGTEQGKTRDYNSGRETGRSKARKEALTKSETDAKTEGEKDGKALGTQQGLDKAFDTGYDKGYAKGFSEGTNKEAYDLGNATGKVDGLANAKAKAAPEKEIAYKKKEKEYLDATLKSVTVGDSGEKFKGTQGRYSADGDDRYYNPTPGSLPHSRLNKFYLEMYDFTYRKELAAQYKFSYEKKKTEDRDYYFEVERSKAYAKDYPQSRADGEAKGFNETYSVVYEENYQKIYPVEKEKYRVIYFNNNKTDQNQIAKGEKEGLRVGSKDKGYKDGEALAYKENLGIEIEKAKAAGIADAKALYDNNPVIKIESLALVEADRDGVYRPGENLIVEIRMKNFGLKPKTDLAIAMRDSSGSIVVSTPAVTTGAIEGQSNALVYAPLQALVDANAKNGASLATQVVAYTQSKIFIQQKFSFPVQYPASVQLVGFDGILVPGVETPVKLILKNRSNSAQKLDLSHVVDSSKVTLDKSSTLGFALNPQETKEIVLKLTGKPEAKFEETSFETTTKQSNLQFAMPVRLAMTLIKRHMPTAESKGLIISSNLARGGGKKLFESDKFDTWDLRVDGAIQTESTLSNYNAKAVHVMADVPSAVDAQTLAQLRAFFTKGGSIVVWGDRLSESEIGRQFLSMAEVQAGRVVQLNEKVAGTDFMRGLSFNIKGYATLLQAASATKTTTVLSSSVGPIMTMSANNIFNNQVGYIVLAGFSTEDITAQESQGLVNSLNISKLAFDQKLEAMKSNAAGYAPYVFIDIKNEMNSAFEKDYYRDNIGKSKLVAAIKKMLSGYGANSEQTKQFVKYYPEIDKLSGKGGNFSLVVDKTINKDRTFNRKTLKEIYCDHNKNDKNYCKSSGGWPIGGD